MDSIFYYYFLGGSEFNTSEECNTHSNVIFYIFLY